MKSRESAAAYVLGELEGRKLAEFKRQLAADPELRAEVETLRAMTGQLEELPANAWPHPGEAGAAAGISKPRRIGAIRPALALGMVLAALVVGGVIGAALRGGDSGGSDPAPVITLSPLDAPARSGADISMPDPETMLLEVHGLPRSGADQYYEIWLMSDAASTVPVASFRVGPSGAATVEVPLPADPADFRYFDVSRQTLPAGTVHSSDSVLRGSTAAS